MLMLVRKFENLRLYMAGITQNKQECLIFIVTPQARKNVNYIKRKCTEH